jgi:hypothetical protein
VDELTPEYVAREIIRPEVDSFRMVLCGETISQMWTDTERLEMLERMAEKFAAVFARENPGFNRHAFETACGFNE